MHPHYNTEDKPSRAHRSPAVGGTARQVHAGLHPQCLGFPMEGAEHELQMGALAPTDSYTAWIASGLRKKPGELSQDRKHCQTQKLIQKYQCLPGRSRNQRLGTHNKVSGNQYGGNDSHLSYYTLHGKRLRGHSKSLADTAEVGTTVEPPTHIYHSSKGYCVVSAQTKEWR